MSKIKNIIFDWSGVINDNSRAVHFAVNYILKKYNKPPSSYQYFRQNWSANYMKFYKKHTPELSLDDQLKLYLEALKKYGPVKACPGMVEVLKKLKENKINLFVDSMDPAIMLDQQVIDYGLKNIFTEIVSGSKNKAEDIKELIPKHNLNPQGTLIIGDTSHEIESGKAAGIKTGAVTWGIFTKERLKKCQPDYIFNTPQEIIKNV